MGLIRQYEDGEQVDWAADLDGDDISPKSVTADEVTSDAVYSDSNYADAIVFREPPSADNAYQYWVEADEGEIYRGYSAADALQTAVDHDSAGLVYLTDEGFGLESPVTVPENVTLDAHQGSRVVNKLDDEYKYPLKFNAGSSIRHLGFDAFGQQGVLIGEDGAFGNNNVEYIDVANPGNSTDPDTGEPQTAVKLTGYQHNIFHMGCLEGNVGFDINASDVFIEHLISVNSVTGVRANCSHTYIANADIESYKEKGIAVERCNGFMVNNCNLWLNTVTYSPNPSVAAEIGNGGQTSNTYIDFNINNGAPTAVELHGNVQDSLFDIQISNFDPLGWGADVTTGVDFVDQVGQNVYVNTQIPESLDTKITGTTAGATIDGIAQEAAGVGNKPTASNYSQYQFVSNTDDGSLYWKDDTGSMRSVYDPDDYQEGGIQPVATFGTGKNRTITTSEDTFGDAGGYNQLQLFLNWDDIVPSDAETYVFVGVQLDFSEKGSYQIYNNTDGEVVGDTIGPSTGNTDSGWVKYEPTTTTDTLELFPRLKSQTQGTETQAQSPTFMIGIER